MFKKKIITIASSLIIALSLFASESSMSSYVEGCKLYAEGDWTSATIMLKKAVAYPENFNDNVYYMLITSEIYDGDDKSALDDCNTFLLTFPDSSYTPHVKYHKGYLLYKTGEYEKAIIELSDFCHQYLDNELYPYALFYIGESLFAGFRYDEARAIFERIVTEFPQSDKAPASQYRIDTILQHGREEKLLYLLKQTGEEYLSAKEEYEKQLKMYNSDAVMSAKQRLAESQAKNNTLEKQVKDLEQQLEDLKKEAERLEGEKLQLESDYKTAEENFTNSINNMKNNSANVTITSNDNDSKQNDVSQKVESKVQENKVPEGTINTTQPPLGVDIPSLEPYDEMKEQLRILKEKAQEAQQLLESKSGK